MPTTDAAPTPAPVGREPSPEPHFGDLRKGAYLKRRAAYLLQIDSAVNLPTCKIPDQAANDPPDKH